MSAKIELQVICKECGEVLNIYREAQNGRIEVKADHCVRCLAKKQVEWYDEGADIGYNEGHRTGYDEGYQDGFNDCNREQNGGE